MVLGDFYNPNAPIGTLNTQYYVSQSAIFEIFEEYIRIRRILVSIFEERVRVIRDMPYNFSPQPFIPSTHSDNNVFSITGSCCPFMNSSNNEKSLKKQNYKMIINKPLKIKKNLKNNKISFLSKNSYRKSINYAFRNKI